MSEQVNLRGDCHHFATRARFGHRLAVVVAALAVMMSVFTLSGSPADADEPTVIFTTMATGVGVSTPMAITVGPDGNLWFTNDNSSIGMITPDGVVSNFTDPGISGPWGITAGPDGNLWYPNYLDDSIGRITPDGVVSNFTGTGIYGPWDITAGPDGNLWFVNYSNNSIGMITPEGLVSNFTDPGISDPLSITAGPDGNLWFVNYSNNSIMRLSIVPTAPVAISGTVTNASAQPIAGATVDLRDETGLVRVAPITTTGADGSYSFTDLEPGNYRIYVRGVPGQYVGMWYGQSQQRPGSAVIDASTQDATGVDVMLLSANPSISGTVTNASAQPIAGAVVDLRDQTGLVRVAPITTTGVDGSYSFADLEPGNYRLYVRGLTGQYVGMWYGQSQQRPASAVIVVNPGPSSGIDVLLPSV